MALYAKLQSWINAVNNGTNLDNEINNIYATTVDLDNNKIGDGDSISTLTVTTLNATNLIANPYVLYIRDEKPNNTDGGTATSGSWQVRTLNTVVRNTISGASLTSNEFTLPVGKYIISASAPALMVVKHQTRIYNVSDSAALCYGTSEITFATDTVQTRSFINNYFEIAGTKIFRLEHQVSSTRATDGFGSTNSFGNIQVYSEVMIVKVG